MVNIRIKNNSTVADLTLYSCYITIVAYSDIPFKPSIQNTFMSEDSHITWHSGYAIADFKSYILNKYYVRCNQQFIEK